MNFRIVKTKKLTNLEFCRCTDPFKIITFRTDLLLRLTGQIFGYISQIFDMKRYTDQHVMVWDP